VGAQEGRQFQIQQARSQFANEIGQVLRQRRGLAKEIGAFTALTGRELRQEALQRRQDWRKTVGGWSQQERTAMMQQGIDPDTGAVIPGGVADRDANGKAGDQSKAAKGPTQAEIDRRQGKREDRRETLQRLETAAAQIKNYNVPTKGPDGKVAVPPPNVVEGWMIEDGYSKLEIDIARDLARHNGRLSREGMQLLRRLGVRKIPARLRPPSVSTGGNFAPGANGQIRPN
jgi:hypothetical protein